MLASSVSTCWRETGILDALVPMIGRRIVVGRRDDGRNAPRLAASQLQAFEGLRAGDFVHEVTVDVEERRAIAS
jgi:hypothetical protein